MARINNNMETKPADESEASATNETHLASAKSAKAAVLISEFGIKPAMTTAKLALRWGERPREPGFVAADVSPLNFRDEFEPAHTGCYHKSTITTAPSRKTRAHRNVSSVRVSFTRKRLAARARPVTPGGGRASEFGFNRQAGSARCQAPGPLRLALNSSHRALCARRIALGTAKTWPGTAWPPSGTA